MLLPLSNLRLNALPASAARLVKPPEAQPIDVAELNEIQPGVKQPLLSMADALAAALFPGLQDLATGPTPELGRKLLTTRGWTVEETVATRGVARLELDEGELEKIAAGYARNPALATFENEGYCFYDKYRREVPAGSPLACRIGRPNEPSIPVASLEETAVRKDLQDFEELGQDLIAYYLRDATPEQGVTRLANAHEIALEDRLPVVLELAAKTPGGKQALDVKTDLNKHVALRLVAESVANPEEPMDERLQRLLKHHDYSEAFTQKVLQEPWKGLLGLVQRNTSRSGLMQAQFERRTTPSGIWRAYELHTSQHFNNDLKEDRERVAQALIAQVPGEAARMAERLSRGMEMPHRVLMVPLSQDEPLSREQWLMMGYHAAEQNLEPLWDKLSQWPETKEAVATIRRITAQIEDPRARREAIRALCTERTDLGRAGAKMLDRLGEFHSVDEAGVEAARLFLTPDKTELADELLAQCKHTHEKVWVMEAVLSEQTPLKMASQLAEKGRLGIEMPLQPFLQRANDPQLEALLHQIDSQDDRLQGSLVAAVLGEPGADREKLLSTAAKNAIPVKREEFQAEFVRLTRKLAGESPMVQWLSGVPEAGYEAYRALTDSHAQPDLLTRGRLALDRLPEEARRPAALALLEKARASYPAEAMPAFDRLAAELPSMPAEQVSPAIGQLSEWAEDARSVAHLASAESSGGLLERDTMLVVGGMRLARKRTRSGA